MSTSVGEAPESLDELVRPHVDSFDHFLGEALQTIVDLLEPVEVLHSLSCTTGCNELVRAATSCTRISGSVALQRLNFTSTSSLQIEHPGTARRHRVWFENPRVARPVKDDAAGLADKRLFPRDCREGVRVMLYWRQDGVISHCHCETNWHSFAQILRDED